MHTYVDLYFSPDDVSPLDLAAKVREVAGLEFVIGPHDLVFEWSAVEEFRATLARVHRAFAGTGIHYRIETVLDEPTFVAPVPWPPPLPGRATPHPGYDRERLPQP